MKQKENLKEQLARESGCKLFTIILRNEKRAYLDQNDNSTYKSESSLNITYYK